MTVTPILLNNDCETSTGCKFDSGLPDDYIFKVLVESTVTWTERGQEKEVSLYTELADWNA